ncbi:MAG: hypothetical protein ACYS7M_03380 [Planctomycetota bacterium]
MFHVRYAAGSLFCVVLIVGAALVCLLLCTVPACGPTKRKDHYSLLLETGKPALHAVHSQRLTDVMHQLDALALERLPQELDAQGERERHMGEVQEIAASLEQTAEYIPEDLGEDDLSGADRELFLLLTDRLRGQARQLRESASERDVGQVEDTVEQLTATCSACHSLFREVPPL